jgi:hypothetical protein
VVPAWTVLPLSDWTVRQSVPRVGGDEEWVGVGVGLPGEDDLVGEGLVDGSDLVGDGWGDRLGDGWDDWLGDGWDDWLGDGWGDLSGLGEALALVCATGVTEGLGEAAAVCPPLAVHAVRRICDLPPRAAVLLPRALPRPGTALLPAVRFAMAAV